VKDWFQRSNMVILASWYILWTPTMSSVAMANSCKSQNNISHQKMLKINIYQSNKMAIYSIHLFMNWQMAVLLKFVKKSKRFSTTIYNHLQWLRDVFPFSLFTIIVLCYMYEFIMLYVWIVLYDRGKPYLLFFDLVACGRMGVGVFVTGCPTPQVSVEDCHHQDYPICQSTLFLSVCLHIYALTFGYTKYWWTWSLKLNTLRIYLFLKNGLKKFAEKTIKVNSCLLSNMTPIFLLEENDYIKTLCF
jgi:hypothetical protein